MSYLQNIAVNQNDLDLNLNNYSCDDLFELFGLDGLELTEGVLKNVKKQILKTHPDKSKLPSKFYIFFAEAYNTLFRIYKETILTDAQKHIHKYEDNSNHQLLDNFFEKQKEFKNPKNFNIWFNGKFDKYHIKDESERTGYDDWLKSDDGITHQPNNLTENNFQEQFDNLKKTKEIIIHEKVNNIFSHSSFIRDAGTDVQFAYSNTMLSYPHKKTNSHIETVQEHLDNRKLNEAEIMKPTTEKSVLKLQEMHKNEHNEGVQYAFRQMRHSQKQKEEINLFWKDMKLLEI